MLRVSLAEPVVRGNGRVDGPPVCLLRLHTEVAREIKVAEEELDERVVSARKTGAVIAEAKRETYKCYAEVFRCRGVTMDGHGICVGSSEQPNSCTEFK